MRRRHEQSMPFGVFVALALLGAIGGLVTGLSARSMRTASVLPVEEPEPFERTQSKPAFVPAPLAATSTPRLEEYTVRVASAPAITAPVTPEAAETSPQTATAEPNIQNPAGAVRHVSSRPGSVLNDAQIASIKQRLKLTHDQELLWPAVETALRNVSYVRKAREMKFASAESGPMAYVDTNSAEVQQLKSAALALIMRLNDDQKREVKTMIYIMGLESVASSF
jgi:hypothetical protein